eukprot:2596889-Rhodomonas_salina.2
MTEVSTTEAGIAYFRASTARSAANGACSTSRFMPLGGASHSSAPGTTIRVGQYRLTFVRQFDHARRYQQIALR